MTGGDTGSIAEVGQTIVAPSVIIVIGVSGSGKTTIASALADQLGWEFKDADWFHPPENVSKMEAGTPLTDEDRWPWLEGIAAWIRATHQAGEHGVVACSALKRVYRDKLRGDLGQSVRIVFLEGSREVIGDRIAHRSGHFMPATLLASQFATLEPPTLDERPIIVSVVAEPSQIVAQIVSSIGCVSR